jgi:hypothetical protein
MILWRFLYYYYYYYHINNMIKPYMCSTCVSSLIMEILMIDLVGDQGHR